MDSTMDKMRALMSSYYGMQEDEEAAAEDSRDIDSAAFVAVRKTCLESLGLGLGFWSGFGFGLRR